MKNRIAALLAWCVCSLSLVAQAQSTSARPTGFGYVASELLTISELTATLPLLASNKVALVLDWPARDIKKPERYAFVKAAAARGVEVRPWLLLSEEQGLWANSTNAELYASQARLLIDAWLAAGLKPTTFVVDMEMSIDRTRQFAAIIAANSNNNAPALDFLRKNTDRAQYTSATRIYKELVEYAHKKGFKVELSTWTYVLDDYNDFDDGLRQALNVPVDGIAWDVVTIQAYRTLNDALLNGSAPKTTNYYVYDYALRTRLLFGAKAGVIIGMTDPGDLAPTAPVYSGPSQVREDLDAAAWAGVPRENIGLYSLRGVVRRQPASQWFQSPSPISLPPIHDLATALVKLNTLNLDASL